MQATGEHISFFSNVYNSYPNTLKMLYLSHTKNKKSIDAKHQRASKQEMQQVQMN
jgi:hypothetical protein